MGSMRGTRHHDESQSIGTSSEQRGTYCKYITYGGGLEVSLDGDGVDS